MSKIKNKIIVLLPAWLSLLSVILLSQYIFKPDLRSPQKAGIFVINDSANKPQVLGAAIGDNLNPIAKAELTPVKVNEMNFSRIKAESFLVYDFATEQVLAEKNPQEKLPIASLTKLLTGLITYDALDMNSKIAISNKVSSQNISPSLGLKEGDKVKVFDLFSAMLVGSCNDAALALAGEVENKLQLPFDKIMNDKAKNLGLTNSHFSNPLGFDNGVNYSTAQDLKKISLKAFRLAAFANLSKSLEYVFESEQQNIYKTQTSNKLLKNHPEIESLKTGFTPISKGSMITRITQDNNKIVIVVIGSENRENDTLALKEQIFDNYIWR